MGVIKYSATRAVRDVRASPEEDRRRSSAPGVVEQGGLLIGTGARGRAAVGGSFIWSASLMAQKVV